MKLACALLLVFCGDAVQTNKTPINYCYPVQRKPTTEMPVITWDTFVSSCYFIVRDSQHRTLDNGVFSIEGARSLCEEHHATLMTVRSKFENDGMRVLGSYAPLGVKIRKEVAKENPTGWRAEIESWDDGVNSKYQPPEWRVEGDAHTFVANNGSWYSYPKDMAPLQYNIVCKQNWTSIA